MRRYREGRLIREYAFAFRRKSLLRPKATGWNELGYMFVGSSMMFSDVQSLMCYKYERRGNGDTRDERNERTDVQHDFRA